MRRRSICHRIENRLFVATKESLLSLDTQTLQQHVHRQLDQEVKLIATSRTGELALAFSDKIDLWNIEAQALEAQLPYSGNLTKLRFSPDGSRLLGLGKDQTLTIWDPISQLPFYSTKVGDDFAYDLKFTADGHWLLLGSLYTHVIDISEPQSEMSTVPMVHSQQAH